jgi:hypothetical protein
VILSWIQRELGKGGSPIGGEGGMKKSLVSDWFKGGRSVVAEIAG